MQYFGVGHAILFVNSSVLAPWWFAAEPSVRHNCIDMIASSARAGLRRRQGLLRGTRYLYIDAQRSSITVTQREQV